MRIVEITWLDAAGTSEDVNTNVATDFLPIERKNVGYVLRDDAEKVVISWGFLYDGIERSDATKVLPRGMITEIKELGYVSG